MAKIVSSMRMDPRREYLRVLGESGLTERDAETLGFRLVRTDEAASRAHGIHVHTEWSIEVPYFDRSGRPVLTGEDGGGVPYFRLRRLGSLVGFAAQAEDPDDVPKYQNPADTRPFAYFPRGLLKQAWAEIADDPRTPIFIVEGEKKAACMCRHDLATIGIGGVYNFGSQDRALEFLPELASIAWRDRPTYIVFDADAATNFQVGHARRVLASRLNHPQRRATVRIVEIPLADGMKGADDYIVGRGIEAFRRLVENARKIPARVAIMLGAEVEEEVERAISALPNAFNIYQRNGRLVHLTRQPKEPPATSDATKPVKKPAVSRPAGVARITDIQATRLQGVLSTVTTCLKPGQDQPKAVPPPHSLAEGVLQRGEWPGVPVLTALVEAPTLLPDGSVLTTPGYHAATGLYYEPSGLGEIALPDRPSRLDAQRVLEKLLDLVCDVGFATECDRSAWLAALLTPFCRAALPSEPAPMFVVDGNMPGVGKTLIAPTVIGLIYRGRPMSIMEAPENDAEMAKRLTMCALAGDPLICIDNVEGDLGYPSLNGVLTLSEHKGRILGRNDSEALVDVAMAATFYATGNNISYVGEIVRRLLPIRIISSYENPEARDTSKFKYSDLRGYVRQHRTELVTAALTMLRAYVLAGRPVQQMVSFGSFEAWSALVRGAIIWAGQPDPAGRRQLFAEKADKKLAQLAAIIAGLKTLQDVDVRCEPKSELKRRDGIAAKDIPTTAARRLNTLKTKKDDPAALTAEERETLKGLTAVVEEIAGAEPRFDPRRLGNTLRYWSDRVVGENRFVMEIDRHSGVARYKVEPVTQRRRAGGIR